MEKQQPVSPKPDMDLIAHEARQLLRSAQVGALGTVDKAGWPLVTRVALATTLSGEPLLLISRMAAHTRNIDAEKRISLMVEGQPADGDPMTTKRLSLIGEFVRLPDADVQAAKRRFIGRHAGSEFYDTELDFHYGKLVIKEARFNQGFGAFNKLKPAELLIDVSDEFEDAEDRMVTHMNEDHLDAVAHYVTAHLSKADTGSWRISGLDPEGVDMTDGAQVTRLAFPAPVSTPTETRQTLVALAKR